MQNVCRQYADKKIVLLIESLDDAAENKEQRAARRRFYLKNGFTSSDIFIEGASGEMEILNYCGNVSQKEYLALQEYALVLLSAVGQMLLPSFLAQMISHGVAEGENRVIWMYAMIMAGVTVLSCVISFLSVKIASYISTDFAAQLRNQVFSKVQEFSAAEMDKFGTASLVTRSTSDITNVQNFLTLLL